MDSAAVESAGDGQHSIEVVVLLQDQHDLQHSLHHGHSLLGVVGLQDGLLQVPGEVGGVPHHPQQVGTPLVFVLTDPGQVDELAGFDSFIVGELDECELSGDLYWMESQQFRPVLCRVLYVSLNGWRRSVKVEHNFLGGLVIIEPPLDNFADAFHPLSHGLARNLVKKGSQFVK